jgi:hypothetical protein
MEPPRRAIRSAADRVRLVEAVRDSPAGTQESDWLEWKGSLELAKPAGRFEIARFILGAANREVERAAAAADGTAYSLVGWMRPRLVLRPVDLVPIGARRRISRADPRR